MGTPAAIGPWRVVRELGSGGMGTVYEAVDTDGKPATVKTVRPDLLADERTRERFEHERRVLTRVQGDDGIPKLLGVGDDSAVGPWMAMELLVGETLAARVAQGQPIPPPHAQRIIEQLAQTLLFCHKKGVFHRDVKGENVFLCRDGRVVLLDFGISIDTKGVRQTTVSGTSDNRPLPHTRGFCPPEAHSRDRIDPWMEWPWWDRWDVYSLGALLYHMLTLRDPSPKGPLDPTEAGTGLPMPPRSVALCAAATQFTPAERPTLVQVLAWWQANTTGQRKTVVETELPRPAPAPASARPWLRGLVIASALLGCTAVLLALVAVLAWALSRHPDPAPPSVADTDPPPVATTATDTDPPAVNTDPPSGGADTDPPAGGADPTGGADTDPPSGGGGGSSGGGSSAGGAPWKSERTKGADAGRAAAAGPASLEITVTPTPAERGGNVDVTVRVLDPGGVPVRSGTPVLDTTGGTLGSTAGRSTGTWRASVFLPEELAQDTIRIDATLPGTRVPGASIRVPVKPMRIRAKDLLSHSSQQVSGLVTRIEGSTPDQVYDALRGWGPEHRKDLRAELQLAIASKMPSLTQVGDCEAFLYWGMATNPLVQSSEPPGREVRATFDRMCGTCRALGDDVTPELHPEDVDYAPCASYRDTRGRPYAEIDKDGQITCRNQTRQFCSK